MKRLHSKSVRRLMILAAIATVGAASLGIAFQARRYAFESRVDAQRLVGMNAFNAKDYPHALASLKQYIAARPTDVDALFALGCARQAVETQNREHLFDARARFQQLLALKPDHQPAKLRLIEIYDRLNFTTEQLAMSEQALAAEPNNPVALRHRAAALSRLDRTAEATEAWRAFVRVAPEDVRAQSELMSAMRRNGATATEVVEHARTLAAANAANPRFQLPLAEALREAGDEAGSLALLRQLAAMPPTDPVLVIDVAAALDRGRAFDEAERLLARAADTLDSATLSTALVERMWQNARHQQVIDTSERLLASGRQEPTMLALRALSLAAMGRREQATPVLARLRGLTDAPAKAWSDALSVEFAATPMSPVQRVQTLRDAVARDPENGILFSWLARALMQVGELDKAARCYREAAQRMPSWPTPCIELAHAMLSAGRNADAAIAAKAAYLRSPTSAIAQIAVARVRMAALQARPDATEEAQLFTFVDGLRKHLPDEPSLITIHAGLLARRGDNAAAADVVRQALARSPDADALVELYRLDRRHTLGVADEVLAHAERTGRLSPTLAGLASLELARAGKTSAAIAAMRERAAPHPADPAWALAELRLRTALGDAAAAADWTILANRFPDDLAVQLAALSEGAAVVTDRAAQGVIIERLKRLTGDDALTWRVEQARFLANATNVEDVRQALALATDLVRQQPGRADLRVLLARVLIKLDSASTALEHLRAAYDQSPADAAIGLELAGTHRHLGRDGDADVVLRRMAGFDYDDPAARLRVAAALADAGLNAEMIAMLERARQRHMLDAAAKLMLAEALDGDGQTDAAATLYDELAAQTDASPSALAAAAAADRRAGRAGRANERLARVERCNASPAKKHQAIARFHASFGSVADARKHYDAALADPTADAALAREAIALECAHRDLARATSLIKQASDRFGRDPQIVRASIEVAALGSGDDATVLTQLIKALAQDPNSRQEAATLAALEASRRAGGNVTAELATQLAKLAAQYPASLELQREAVNACLATGQNEAAVNIAHRLAGQSANRQDAVELAARTFVSCGQWNSARRAAERWRAMTGDDAARQQQANLLLAEVAIGANRPRDAVALLEPYRHQIELPRDARLLELTAAALVADGRAGETFALLQPLAGQSPIARSVWLASATAGTDPVATLHQLDRLAEATPADAHDERMRIAATMLRLAERSEASDVLARGIRIMAALADSGGLPPRGRVLYAELLRMNRQPDRAEQELRAALRDAPTDATAKNSLAYLLVSQRRALEEALALAMQAADALPGQANVRDTLARAEALLGRADAAEQHFREALRLDPECLDAMVGLASLQGQRGQSAELQQTLASLDRYLAAGDRRVIPMHLRAELAALRPGVSTTR